MKRNLQIALLILALGIGLAGYQIYNFRAEEIPKMEAERKKKTDEIDAKVNELRKLQNFAQNIESVKQELKELNLQFESLLEYMPRTFNLSAILRKLTMLAQNSGVKMGAFKPSKSEEKGQEGFYSSMAIGFELKGSFAQTLVFMDQLSRLKRIVNIQTLKIITDGNDPNSSQLGPTQVATSLNVRTYRFSEQ